MRRQSIARYRNLVLLCLLAAPFGPGSAVGAADRIVVGTAGANAGTAGVSVDVNITHDQPIHAFSLAVTFDPLVLSLRKITDEGTALASLNPEFFYPTINNDSGTAVLGVIFSYNDVDFQQVQLEASPDVPQQVAVLTFDIAPGAPPGDYPIELTNGIGSPPISNVFSRQGQTIRPTLGDGIVTVNNQNIQLVDSANIQPGARFEVRVSGKHPETLQGFSIALTYDKTVLSFVEATFAGTAVAQVLKPQTIEFFQSQVEMDFDTRLARLTAGAVVDYVPPFAGQVIAASPSQFQSMVRLTFQAKNDPSLIGTCTDLLFQNGGVASVNNIFIIDKLSYSPALIDGKVCFDSRPVFLRGRINADARVDLSDAIFLLAHLFLGMDGPGCASAADVNDDGRMDVSDAISLFNYLFNGAQRPREPFEICGSDPTSDDLSCSLSPCQ